MKNTILTLLLLVIYSYNLSGQVSRQGFDNEFKDNWSYTSNIPFYSLNNDSDIWVQKTNSNGRIPGPYSGSTYLAGRDLDNAFSESYAGVPSPEHILTFDPIYIGGLKAEISFKVYYFGIDKGDYIYYQVSYNNGTDWATYDYMQDVFRTSQQGNFNTREWEEFKHVVPAGKEFVRMRLVIYQNGNEYLGFDDFQVITQTLSNDKNLINGFEFGPNPTHGELRLKANVILDRASVYDILGKNVMNSKGDSKEMTLDLSNLPNGLYVVKVESGEISQTLKVIHK
jgi:hypothetical protein